MGVSGSSRRSRVESDFAISRKLSMSVLNLSWGLPVMNRLNKVHLASRVELPNSIVHYDKTSDVVDRQRRGLPIISRAVGILVFVAFGFMVVAMAGFLAIVI